MKNGFLCAALLMFEFPTVLARRRSQFLAMAPLLALAACPPAKFPQVQAIHVRVSEIARDLATFDQVAIETGFVVNERSHEVEGLTYFRYYQNPVRCCLGIGLAKRHQESVWTFGVSDPYAEVREFRAAECATYAKFREALFAKVDKSRVLKDDPIC
jgi:hypothetical protein